MKMVYYHDCDDCNVEMDFNSYTTRHSGDEIVTYKRVNNQPINLALYFPEKYDRTKKYPLFVCVHGGGWQENKVFEDQKSWAGDYLGFLCRYYADKGFISVSIDYRLMCDSGKSENYQIINLYEDCADAVDFLQLHSEEYGMDFSRSVVLGESAGGYLAAALATFNYYRQPAFKTAILVNAITDFTDSRWRKMLPPNSKNPNLEKLSMPEKIEFLSPVQKITKETCPTLLIHGNIDDIVYPRNSQAFHDEMCMHGNESELHWIKNTNHAFLLIEYSISKNRSIKPVSLSVDIINHWLEKHNII